MRGSGMRVRLTGTRTRPIRGGRAAILATILVSWIACGAPQPRIPQVEQATEAIHGGGERYRTHRTCAGASKSVDELVRCMDAAGWHFVGPGAVYPEPDCWLARDRGELDRLLPQCFVRAPEHHPTP